MRDLRVEANSFHGLRKFHSPLGIESENISIFQGNTLPLAQDHKRVKTRKCQIVRFVRNKLDTLGREHGLSGPEDTIGRLLSVSPDIIASETDMLQAERRHVRDNRRCDIDALPQAGSCWRCAASASRPLSLQLFPVSLQ
jgi:hypothetical protein